MAKFDIKATYRYWAEGIEADTAEEAERIFLEDLNSHYYDTWAFEVEESDEDDEDEEDDE